MIYVLSLLCMDTFSINEYDFHQSKLILTFITNNIPVDMDIGSLVDGNIHHSFVDALHINVTRYTGKCYWIFNEHGKFILSIISKRFSRITILRFQRLGNIVVFRDWFAGFAVIGFFVSLAGGADAGFYFFDKPKD